MDNGIDDNEIDELYTELAKRDTIISELESQNFSLKKDIEKLKGYISCLTNNNTKRGEYVHCIDCTLEKVVLDMINKLPNIYHILHDDNFTNDTICNFYVSLLTGDKNKLSSIAFIDKTIVYKDTNNDLCFVGFPQFFSFITTLIKPFIIDLIKHKLSFEKNIQGMTFDESLINMKENAMFSKNSKILLNVESLPIKKIIKMYQHL